MATGKVTQWNGQTGFLVDDSDGARVFFGDRSLKGIRPHEVQPGLAVAFDRGNGPKGPKALSVRKSDSATPLTALSPAATNSRSGRPDVRLPEFQPMVPSTWVLPVLTRGVIDSVRVEDRHPVIQLDRLSIPGKQEQQRVELEKTVRTFRDSSLLSDLLARRTHSLETLVPIDRMEHWKQKTAGPLTLHLSRANVLENAGICLHPVYGFAYLPGSGLKGMARAAAVTLLKFSTERIVEIFGNEPGEAQEGKQRSGCVCFHDAWPVEWPRLFVDIVNNHHPAYYAGEDAPGDWESPNPVNFLAISPGTQFSFYLTASRNDTPIDLLKDAMRCLQSALSQAGAGAKTAAGYGWFLPLAAGQAGHESPSSLNELSTFALSLDSPAFLAGASQGQEDCDLRSATLRGQLRAWWRTLHSGFLTVNELRQLEAALWGDATQGAAIQFHLITKKRPTVQLHQHPNQRDSGLKYLAYGMDETSRGERKQRWVANPDGERQLEVRFTDSLYHASSKRKPEDQKQGLSIPAEAIKNQFVSALWLLGQYGGVGSKSRKGFGSLRVHEKLPFESLQAVLARAQSIRDLLKSGTKFEETLAESPAISHPGTITKEFTVSAANATHAIELAGKAYSKVAGELKHQMEKMSLGLPRKIHGPKQTPMDHQKKESHKPPLFLLDTRTGRKGKPENERYSSTVQMHVTKASPSQWTVRVVAMPAKYLPDHTQSAKFLSKFIDSFGAVISATSNGAHPPAGSVRPGEPPRTVQGFESVQVKVLEIKPVNNKSQLKVLEVGKEKPGMLIDGTPPVELPNIGDTITAYRSSTSNPSSPRYRWNLPDPPQQDSSKPKWKK